MNGNNCSSFVYTSFIRATPERLWAALTDPDCIPRYWFGMTTDCRWQEGAPWTMSLPDGRTSDTGEILEMDPPRRMVISWRNEGRAELKAEGFSRCTIELAAEGHAVEIVVRHEIDRAESRLIQAVSHGWPRVIANLKSLIETGEPMFKELHR